MSGFGRLRRFWESASRSLILGFGGVFLLALSARWMMTSTRMSSSDPVPELTISTYRSFMGHSGLGSVLFPLFEKRFHCRVRVLSLPDGGALLTRLELDSRRGQFPIQVVLGLDQYLWSRARSLLDDWQGWVPAGYLRVDPDLKLESGFLPYHFGPLALMVDQKLLAARGLTVPHSLSDLLTTPWARQILLQDPRTSIPGMTFLLYTRAVLGSSAKTESFWKKLRAQWLTLAPSWDFSYSLFLKGEAPAVWSYVTSQAYHESHGGESRYRAVLFSEGQPYQVEGAALVRGAFQTEKQMQLARSFLEFLISPEVQRLVPHHAWMMPVISSGLMVPELPLDFLKLPQPAHRIWPDRDPESVRRTLETWRKAVEG